MKPCVSQVMRLRWIASAALVFPAAACFGQNWNENRLLEIARASVIAEVTHTPVPKLESSNSPLPVFVTIEVNGVVRGCRGDLMVRTGSLEREVAQAARDAAAHDPRYRPLSAAELKKFLVTVTVVEREQPLDDVESVTPAEGIVLRSGGRTGVVLPWEGRDPRTRLAWAYRKAGIARNSSVSLSRLIAERFRG